MAWLDTVCRLRGTTDHSFHTVTSSGSTCRPTTKRHHDTLNITKMDVSNGCHLACLCLCILLIKIWQLGGCLFWRSTVWRCNEYFKTYFRVLFDWQLTWQDLNWLCSKHHSNIIQRKSKQTQRNPANTVWHVWCASCNLQIIHKMMLTQIRSNLERKCKKLKSIHSVQYIQT